VAEPVQITMVVPVAAPSANAVVEELRREPLDIELVTADVLRAPPATRVYVFAFSGALALALAERIVAWAHEIEVCPGLIGIVDDGSTSDREALLAAGFDDVVTGTIGAHELSARARAVHRRMFARSRDGRIRYSAVTLDLDNHALWVDGRTISLTTIELAVMRELIKAAGRPLSRAQLLDVAWGAGELEISERAVDNVILRLRRKLPRPELLQTVRSIGFRLTA
jgi:DNA-binding response OmpR family regulator